MNSPFFIYSFEGDENAVFHTITNPVTGKSCYPDILIKHNFTEKGITDNRLYEIAENAIKEYGSSRCFFVSYNDKKKLDELLDIINSIYYKTTSDNKALLITELAHKLMLSQAMTASLKTLLTYYGDFVGDLDASVKGWCKKYNLPVSTKNEGKKIYELIRQQILG